MATSWNSEAEAVGDLDEQFKKMFENYGAKNAIHVQYKGNGWPVDARSYEYGILPPPLCPFEKDVPYKTRADFLQWAERCVMKKGDQEFATWYNDKGAVLTTHTFNDIWKSAGNIAYHIRNTWGCKKGDRVILCYNMGMHFFEVFLGCLRAGVTAVPIYPPNPVAMEKSLKKMNLIVDSAMPVCILYDSDIAKLKTVTRWTVAGGDNWPSMEKYPYFVTNNIEGAWFYSSSSLELFEFDDQDIQEDDVAFLQYTSGSTSDPKGVMITYGNLFHNCLLITCSSNVKIGTMYNADENGVEPPFPERWTGFSWLPQYHDMGLVLGTCSPFVGGGRMGYTSPISFLRNPLIWLDGITRIKANWTTAPEFAFNLVVRKYQDGLKRGRPMPNLDLSCLKIMQCGAEPIRPPIIEKFHELFCQFGLPKHINDYFVASYGLAEHVVGVSGTMGINSFKVEGHNDIVSCGDLRDCGIVGVDLRIVHPETFEVLPDGVAGEIWISSGSVTKGYWGLEEMTKECYGAKINNPPAKAVGKTYLRTGDLGMTQGHYLLICGRIKDLIIIRGKNYYPQDIELTIQDAFPNEVRPGCLACFTTTEMGDDDDLHLVFELQSGIGMTQDDLESLCYNIQHVVASQVGMSLARVVIVSDRTIPKTTSGKIQRRRTRISLYEGSLQIVFDMDLRHMINGGAPKPSVMGGESSKMDVSADDTAIFYDAKDCASDFCDEMSIALTIEEAISPRHGVAAIGFVENPEDLFGEMPQDCAFDLTNMQSEMEKLDCEEDRIEYLAKVILDTARSILEDANLAGELSIATESLTIETPLIEVLDSLSGVAFRNQIISTCREAKLPMINIPFEFILEEGGTPVGIAAYILEHFLNKVLKPSLYFKRDKATGSYVASNSTEEFKEETPSVRVNIESEVASNEHVSKEAEMRSWTVLSCMLAGAQLLISGVLGSLIMLPSVPLFYALGVILEMYGTEVAMACVPVAYVLYNILLMAVVVMFKWVVIGKYRPGVYSVNSVYYLRWWAVDRLYNFVAMYRVYLGKSPIRVIWLKSMGLKACMNTEIATSRISEMDLITIGPGSTIEADAKIRGATVAEGKLVLREIVIGKNSVVRGQSTVLPGSRIGSGVTIYPASLVTAGDDTHEDNTAWIGSPLKSVEEHRPTIVSLSDSPYTTMFDTCCTIINRSLWSMFCLTLAGACMVASTIPAARLIRLVGPVDPYYMEHVNVEKEMLWLAILSCFDPITVVLAPVFIGYDNLLLMIAYSNEHGCLPILMVVSVFYCLYGWTGLLLSALVKFFFKGVFSSFQMISAIGVPSHKPEVGFYESHFNDILINYTYYRMVDKTKGSVVFNVWLNLLGAKVDLSAKCSLSSITLDPSKLEVKSDAVITPWVTLEENKSCDRGIVIGSNAIVGVMSYISGNSTVSENSTVAPLSSVTMYRENKSCSLSKQTPGTPSVSPSTAAIGASFTQVRAVDTITMYANAPSYTTHVLCQLFYSCVAPFYMGICIFSFVFMGTYLAMTLDKVYGSHLLLAFLPVVFLASAFTLCAVTLLTKYFVLSSFSESAHHVDSSYAVKDLFVQQLIFLNNFFFIYLLPGSEAYNCYLRVLGLKVGVGSRIFCADMCAYNLISIGENVTIARDVLISPSTYVPRKVYKNDVPVEETICVYGKIEIGAHASLGDCAVVLSDVIVGRDCLVGPMTMCSNDLELKEGRFIQGCPPLPCSRYNDNVDIQFLNRPETDYPSSILSDCTLPAELARMIRDAKVDGKIFKDGNKQVLLTGASGFCGRFMLVDLLKQDDVSKVYCIVRGKNDFAARARIMDAISDVDAHLDQKYIDKLEVYAGNTIADCFGMSRKVYETLCNTVTHVFHSAAQLSYSQFYDRLKKGNVDATLRCMEFCVTGQTKLFCHVSTMGVITPDMIDKNGMILESYPLGDIYCFPAVGSCDQTHGYAQSKWVAELLTQKAAVLGLPCRIFRLPQISGHSRTGFTPDNRNDLLADFIKDSIKLRMVPAINGTLVNISPVDIVSYVMIKAGLDSSSVDELCSGKLAKVYHVVSKEYNLETENLLEALSSCGYHEVKVTKIHDWRSAIVQRYGLKTSTEISAMLWFCSYYQSQNESIDKHLTVGPEVEGYLEEFALKNPNNVLWIKYHMNTVIRHLQSNHCIYMPKNSTSRRLPFEYLKQ